MQANKRKISLLKRREKSAIEMGQEEKTKWYGYSKCTSNSDLVLCYFPLLHDLLSLFPLKLTFPLLSSSVLSIQEKGKKLRRKHDITCFPLHQTPSIFLPIYRIKWETSKNPYFRQKAITVLVSRFHLLKLQLYRKTNYGTVVLAHLVWVRGQSLKRKMRVGYSG